MAKGIWIQALCWITAFMVFTTPGLALAGPVVDSNGLRSDLRKVEKQITNSSNKHVDVPALRSALGLDALMPSTQTASGSLTPIGARKPALDHTKQDRQDIGDAEAPIVAGVTNFRIMLAMLAQAYTGENNQAVINAQGPRGDRAVSIRSGTVTLDQLQRLSAEHGMPAQQDGTLTGPVVLWPDATLHLKAGERLAFARDKGAFLFVMGKLVADRTIIETVGLENPYTPSFVPFVTVMSGGTLDIQRSVVRGLGFGATTKFIGLSVAANPMLPKNDQQILLKDNVFEDIKMVTVSGAGGVAITGNTFTNARNSALTLLHSPDSVISNNLFHGSGPTNAIRIDKGSDGVLVDENVFFAGQRVAVLIKGRSDNVVVRNNLIWRRDGAGIKFLNARCGRAEGNIILDNRQKGIELRRSDGMVVRKNFLARNRSGGVWVSSQPRNAKVAIQDNVFQSNGAGLVTATGAEVWSGGNDFSKQLPRILDGDITRLTSAFARDLRGADTLLLANGQASVQPEMAALCGGT